MRILGITVAAVLAVAAAACGSGGSGKGAAGQDAGGSTDAAAQDENAAGDDSAFGCGPSVGPCNGLVVQGGALQSQPLADGGAWVPAGGTIASGTYHLTQFTAPAGGTSPGGAPTTVQPITIQVSPGCIQAVGPLGADNVPASFALKETGTNITLTESCPEGGDYVYGFTATPTTLTLGPPSAPGVGSVYGTAVLTFEL
ncbi:MAG TPA: hypothetical protein VIY73_28920 [Polyangiaceae bacterium]